MGAGAEQVRGILVSGRFPELEEALTERVRELRAGRPLVPLTVVVGSSAARTRVGDVLVRRLGAVANVSVLTLAQLARRLATEKRGTPPVQLAGLTSERLLRRLVSERAGRGLAYFGPVADRPHFPLALSSTFADLRQALVAPDTAWAREGLGAQGAAEKAADLEELYTAYCSELGRRGLADDAQLHADAAQRVREIEGRPPQGAERDASRAAAPPVVIYGIYDLNSAQEELVAALLDAGAQADPPAHAAEAAAAAVAVAAAAAGPSAGPANNKRRRREAAAATASGSAESARSPNQQASSVAVQPTPLVLAVAVGSAQLVSRLLAAGADVNRQCTMQLAGSQAAVALTPLIAAVNLGSAPMVQQLLEAGADLHQKCIAPGSSGVEWTR